jgi:hypothetical protein
MFPTLSPNASSTPRHRSLSVHRGTDNGAIVYAAVQVDYARAADCRDDVIAEGAVSLVSLPLLRHVCKQ